MLKVDQINDLELRSDGQIIPETDQNDLYTKVRSAGDPHDIIHLHKNPCTGRLTFNPTNASHSVTTGINVVCRRDQVAQCLKKAEQDYLANLKKELFMSDDTEQKLVEFIFNKKIAPEALNHEPDWFNHLDFVLSKFNNIAFAFNKYWLDVYKTLAERILPSKNSSSILKTRLLAIASRVPFCTDQNSKDLQAIFDDLIEQVPKPIALDWIEIEKSHSNLIAQHLLDLSHKIGIDSFKLLVKPEVSNDNLAIKSEKGHILRDFIDQTSIEMVFPPHLREDIFSDIANIPTNTPLEKALKTYFLCKPLVSHPEAIAIYKKTVNDLVEKAEDTLFSFDGGIINLRRFLSAGYTYAYQDKINQDLLNELPPILSCLPEISDFYSTNGSVPLSSLSVFTRTHYGNEITKCAKYYKDTFKLNLRWVFDALAENQRGGNSLSPLAQKAWENTFGEPWSETCRFVQKENEAKNQEPSH